MKTSTLIAILLLGFLIALPAYAGGHGEYGGLPNSSPEITPQENQIPFTGDSERWFSIDSINGNAFGPLTMKFIPILDGTAWGSVEFQNRLAKGYKTHSEYQFAYDGRVVYVYLDSGGRTAPDLLTVIPPDGYIAIPGEILVEENTTAVVLIYPQLLG